MSKGLNYDLDQLLSAHPPPRLDAGRPFKNIVLQPFINPLGHADPVRYATDEAFTDPANVLIVLDNCSSARFTHVAYR